jgi:hypothetical protein
MLWGLLLIGNFPENCLLAVYPDILPAFNLWPAISQPATAASQPASQGLVLQGDISHAVEPAGGDKFLLLVQPVLAVK